MQNLLSPTDLRQLEGLRLNPRRSFSGRVRGERLSRKKGLSMEFADYRDYAPGDDLRHLDWAVLARLDRAAIRTHQDEDDLAVYIALDVSRSMDFGEPSKFEHAARLAAALGFIGLTGQDAVYTLPLGGGEPAPGRVMRGRGSVHPLLDWMQTRKPDGERGLAASLKRFAIGGSARPGLFIAVTDGLDPDLPSALRAVAARGHEVALIQVLSDIELDPDLEGDLRLLDIETGAEVEVTAHAQTLREYKENLAAHNEALQTAVTRAAGRRVLSVAGQPLSAVLKDALKPVGLVA